ncbi:MAG: hypothetical protein WC521_09475 [Bdellovibrionales bacterium]
MKSLINHGITRECEVVYLLTCIRKILEQEEGNEQWDALKFYCDWALHAKLTGRTAQSILSSFNEGHSALISQEDNLPSAIQDISKFTGLVSEIQNFLKSRDTNLQQYSNSDWSKFIFLYASIVEDCPLVINPQLSPTSGIKKVIARMELSKKRPSGQQYYKISWIITDASEKEGELYIINSFDA